MAIARTERLTPYPALTTYVERGIEVLWLLTAALVPLIFVPTDFVLSEAVNAYVEVPKTTALRTLVGLMTILWILEWVLKGGLTRRYSIAHYTTRLKKWVVEQPTRWVVVAATFYVVVAIISTFLSVNFFISVWGEVSGQFGYSAYTTVSYFLLFAIIATHLKTRPQLWRLLVVIVGTGALVAFYGFIQRADLDPLDLGETGSARITATMANPVFTGAFLVTSTLMTFGLWLMVLDRWRTSSSRASALLVILLGALAAAQFIAVYWTGSRGSWLIGVPPGVLAFPVLAGVAFGLRSFAKTSTVLAVGLLIALFAALGLDPSDWVSSIKSQTVERGVSFRTEIWYDSLKLVWNRPWFEYEGLSLSFIRPLIGYGPELFKYTFPLESPVGGLLSHAHNFFLHHWVEQGILGLFSSMGLFAAFFTVGAAQLWRNRGIYSTTHKWILVVLMATVLGRLGEMMVGVARESDLVPFWIILAIFVVLPSVMRPSPEVETSPSTPPPPRLGRRERRGGGPGRRERRTRWSSRGYGGQAIGLVLVSAVVVIFIGWVTWDKNVDYAWAARVAAQARNTFSEARFQESQQLASKSISKAPDVPIYYNNLAAIYDSYRDYRANNPDAQLPSCAQFVPLKDGASTPQGKPTDAECIEGAYLANLNGFQKNRTSPQAKLMLANSTLKLALLDRNAYKGKDAEAIRYYRELTQMIPWSWPLFNAWGTAAIRLGRFEEALAPLEKSLSITQGSAASARALYLKGLVHRELGETQKAIASFEQNLAISSSNPNVDEVRRQLVITYNAVAAADLNQKRAQEALETLEKSLSITQGSSSSGTALYLQGVAYRELGALEKSVESLERSLEVDGNGPNAAEAHNQLAAVYAALGDQAQANAHAKLYQELKNP